MHTIIQNFVAQPLNMPPQHYGIQRDSVLNSSCFFHITERLPMDTCQGTLMQLLVILLHGYYLQKFCFTRSSKLSLPFLDSLDACSPSLPSNPSRHPQEFFDTISHDSKFCGFSTLFHQSYIAYRLPWPRVIAGVPLYRPVPSTKICIDLSLSVTMQGCKSQ